jgi:hypothetical protein
MIFRTSGYCLAACPIFSDDINATLKPLEDGSRVKIAFLTPQPGKTTHDENCTIGIS